MVNVQNVQGYLHKDDTTKRNHVII